MMPKRTMETHVEPRITVEARVLADKPGDRGSALRYADRRAISDQGSEAELTTEGHGGARRVLLFCFAAARSLRVGPTTLRAPPRSSVLLGVTQISPSVPLRGEFPLFGRRGKRKKTYNGRRIVYPY